MEQLHGRFTDEQVGNEAEDKTNSRAVAGKEGLTLDFARTIWRCAFWLGSGCFWYETPPGCGVFRYSGYSWSRPPLWEGGPEWPHLVDMNKLEFPYSISSPEEELVELWLENTLIAGGSLEQVRKCRDVHHGMILSYKDSKQVIELLQLDNDLVKLEKEICAGLDKALQEGTHLGDIDA